MEDQNVSVQFGDLVVQDLETQYGVDYARKSRELAVLRTQYTQLLNFVRSKKDILGLTEEGVTSATSPDPEVTSSPPKIEENLPNTQE